MADLEKHIEIEDVGDLGRFLGRRRKIVATASGKGIAFNVRDYMKSAVDIHKAVATEACQHTVPSSWIHRS